MNDSFAARVSAAAAAAWWTILIGAVVMTAWWFGFLCMMKLRPGWILRLRGAGMTWDQVQSTVIIFFAVLKMILTVTALAALWLTLWGRRLRRAA